VSSIRWSPILAVEATDACLEEGGWLPVEDIYGPNWAAQAEFDFMGPAPEIDAAVPGSKVVKILNRRPDGQVQVKFQSGSIRWTDHKVMCQTPDLLLAYLACCGVRPKL
jgi:hypothetical protein